MSSAAAQLLRHAWPVLVAQLSSIGMMLADTLIAGHYGTTALAAVAIGSGLYISVVMLLVGIVQALAPVVAHHVGAQRHEAIAPALQQGFWLAAMLAVPGVWALRHPEALLAFAQVPPQIAPLTRDYLAAVAWGLPAVLGYRTFYAFSNAMGHPRVLMFISIATTLTHVPLAWALTNGALGLAALGAVGCGVSTALVCWLAFAVGLFHLRHQAAYRRYALFSGWTLPDPAALRELLRLGLPMGLSTFVEITSFTLIALLVAPLGADIVAGHRIVANLGALAYMVPLSLSIATLVLVGQALGAHDPERAQRAWRSGLAVATGLATALGAALWWARDAVLAMHTDDGAVLAVAAALVFYICVYQFFDAMQTVAAHALRGYKIAFAPMLIHVGCFWGIGLAGGWWLCFRGGIDGTPAGVAGFWQAAVVSTLIAALAFLALLHAATRRDAAPTLARAGRRSDARARRAPSP